MVCRYRFSVISISLKFYQNLDAPHQLSLRGSVAKLFGVISMAFNRLLLPSNLLTACMFEDTDAAINTDEIPIVVEMNKQFGSPGSTVNLSGQDLSDWISMQSLCARLSRSDNAKSIIYLDHCCLGRHGAAIVSRSFTHVLIRAGSYVAKWLPLMHPNGRIIVLRYF